MKRLQLLLLAVLFLLLGVAAFSEENVVKIGVMWPLTGPMPYIGNLLKEVTDLCADLVNNSYDIDSPGDIFRSEGLPNLNGAKIQLIYADNEANPDIGRAAAERLITVDEVHALLGSECSGVTLTESDVAERYGIPMINGTSTSPTLTARGFKYFFRTTPHAEQLVGTILQFLKDLDDEHGISIQKIAVVCEDTQWGQDAANVIRDIAANYGFEIVVDIAYPHGATDVDAEVLRVKRSDADVIFMSSYDPDAILFQKAYKRYNVEVPIVGNGTGHLDRIFYESLDSDTNYVLTRDLWSDYMLETISLAGKLDGLLKARGVAEGMGEEQGRTFIAFLALVDAINRAGSTDPDTIRQALTETHISSEYLSLPWEAVVFDENGQNIHGRGLITQWHDGKLKAVWPWETAEVDVVWHLPPWSER